MDTMRDVPHQGRTYFLHSLFSQVGGLGSMFLGILLAASYSYWLESICFRLILRYAYIF